MLEMDFAFPGRPTFMDVWLDIHHVWLLGNVRVGQWRQPLYMDGLTSAKELTFLERPLPFALIPFRQIGVGLHNTNRDESLTWAFSGIRFPTDQFGGIGTPDGISADLSDQGYGAIGRVTTVIGDWDDCSPLLHVGGGFAHLAPGTRLVEYRYGPEFFGPFVGPAGNIPSVPFFVDTGPVGTDNIQLYNAELAVRLGSWYAQSEATYAVVNDTAGNTLTFPGAYAQMGYFLTGEVRPYNRHAGVFGRVQPLRDFGFTGWGAWWAASPCASRVRP
jgi:phosphate-selective porin OprO/OprP